jgi:hypothetical protein
MQVIMVSEQRKRAAGENPVHRWGDVAGASDKEDMEWK